MSGKKYWCTTLWPDYLWPLYKSGFIFQGLNVSCETSVCCVTCDCSPYAFAMSLSASKRVSLAEIVRLNLTQTQWLFAFFFLFLESWICAHSLHMWLAFGYFFYIYEKETCDSESWKEGDWGARWKKSSDGCLWENKQIGYNERCECSARSDWRHFLLIRHLYHKRRREKQIEAFEMKEKLVLPYLRPFPFRHRNRTPRISSLRTWAHLYDCGAEHGTGSCLTETYEWRG